MFDASLSVRAFLPVAVGISAVIVRYLVVSLCLLFGPLAATADAGQLTALKNFAGTIDPRSPWGSLLLDGPTLYGTTAALGGTTNGGNGNVFKINPDGTGYQELHGFVTSPAFGGANFGPAGLLAKSGTTLFGTVQMFTPVPNWGLVYAVDADASQYHVVHEFTEAEGVGWPMGGVVLQGSTLYGTASSGAVFRVNTDGSDFHVLQAIPDAVQEGGGVTLVGSTLYGTTIGGGQYDRGTIYKINTDGSDYQVLHQFAGGATDGEGPRFMDLVTDGSFLYGTTQIGGSANEGTVFRISLDGSDFQLMHSFPAVEGGRPQAGLTLVGSALYGVTGGALGIFRINTDGTGFESLYQATGPQSTLLNPRAALTPGGPNVFYGTTYGSGNSGTVFMFVVPEPSGLALLAIGLAGVMAIVRRRGILIARSA